MPRVNVVWFPEYDEYLILSDEEIEELQDADLHREWETYQVEIPRTRLKYYNEAATRWAKAQEYLTECFKMAQATPHRVRRFK